MFWCRSWTAGPPEVCYLVRVKSYGEYCPVSKAAEVLAERWTPLIVRELLMGSRRFNELQIGVPGIPRSLLVQRLRMLERNGVVVRQEHNRAHTEYGLTKAGQELFDIIYSMGVWGQRWVNAEVTEDDLDPRLLMWDMRRRLNHEVLPDRRVVVRFDFRGAKKDTIWLVASRDEASVCFHDPGFDVDMVVTADTMAMHRVWTGRLPLGQAIREGRVALEGPRELVRGFPKWLALSLFADVRPVAASGRR